MEVQMDKRISVTVMITYYNQKEYIFDSLTSVLNQKTSFDFEIICGDDGSTDGTYEELLEWQKRYPNIIKVIQMPRVLGKKYEPIVRVSNCRFTMYGQAKGEYVIFLDGDDYFIDNKKLEKQKKLLDDNPSCIGAAHPIEMIWDGKPKKKQIICAICNNTTIINNKLYWSYTWIHADTFMFRNIYEKNNKYISPEFFDDNTIVANFLKYGDIIYSPDCMVAYRQIEGSSWNRRNALQRAYVNLYVYSEAEKILKNWKFINWIRSFSDFKEYYKNRSCDIENITGNKFDYKNLFIERTKSYENSNLLFKFFYHIRYGLFMKCGIFISIYRKLAKIKIEKGVNKIKK